MTGRDIDGALARGAPAVEVLADYVAACRALGHCAADPGQLHDAYTAEDGMDLGALDADCAAITAALGAVDEAVRLQECAQASLTDAWQGPGADAANQVIAEHARSSVLAQAALRRVGDTLGELRDTLWHLVSGKVAAVQDIEDRAEREQWWPAARAVTTGAGAQDTASEIVDGKVNPFVTVAIGSEWDDVMKTTQRSVRDAYDAAAAGISADPPAFGAPAAATTPATAAAPAVAAPAPTAEPLSAGLPASGMGTGMSGLGGVFAGMGQQIADLIGGLLDAGSDAPDGEPLDLDDPDADGPERDEDRDDTDDPDEPDDDTEDESAADDGEAEDEESPDEQGEPAAGAAQDTQPAVPQPDPPTPTPTPVPEPVAAAPIAPPPAAPEPPRTPCEIAADELPQAGD
jgi:hypothetical protein